MSKVEFLKELENCLSGLPKAEVEEYLGFYSEMIDDYIEDGFSEEEAVVAAGSAEKIAEDIIADTPITKLVKQKIKPKKRLSALAITLIALGSPIWLALLISAFAVVLALYIALWAVVISLWAAFVAVLACGLGGIASGVFLICCKSGLTGLFLIGAGLVCIGVAIFLFFLCKLASRGVVLLLASIIKRIKNKIAKRSERDD